MLEDELNQRLTQVILMHKTRSFSVSKINRNINLLMLIGWLCLFVFTAFPVIWTGIVSYSESYQNHLPCMFIGLAAIFLAWVHFFWRTELSGRSIYSNSKPSSAFKIFQRDTPSGGQK